MIKSKKSNSCSDLVINKNILPKSKRSNSHFKFLSNNRLLNSKRSQSAIEFFILTGFLLFSFTIFFVAIQGNMEDKLRERQELAIKNVAITVQDEINLASQSMEGYYRQFKIPENINGKEYEINATEGLVYVKTLDGKYALALPVKKITGDVQKGNNIIKKENGIVKLNIN
jgi:hypothetical protein